MFKDTNGRVFLTMYWFTMCLFFHWACFTINMRVLASLSLISFEMSF